MDDAGVEIILVTRPKMFAEIGRAVRYARRLGFQPDSPAQQFSNSTWIAAQ
jgi:hypothetical protein